MQALSSPTVLRQPHTAGSPPVSCAECGGPLVVRSCPTCGAGYCDRHHDPVFTPRLAAAWPPASCWVWSGLAIAVVGALTALGVALGLTLGAAVRGLWPTASQATIEVLTGVLGFDLAWWWYATVGQRWIANGTRAGP